MLHRPAFDPRWRVTLAPRAGVFFEMDRDHAVFCGRSFEGVASLIDGRRTSEEIVNAIGKRVDPAESYYALMELERRGCVRESAQRRPRRDSDLRDKNSTGAAAATFARISNGVRVIIAADYLAPELNRQNREALRLRRPWMIAKAAGAEIWLGPLFVPGETACWTCLADRLRRLRPIAAFLGTRRSVTVLSRPAPVSADALRQFARLLRGTKVMPGVTLTFDIRSSRVESHVVVKRPQCPECGDPATYRRQLDGFDVDRGGRSNVARQRARLVGPVAGITASVTRVRVPVQRRSYVYVALPATVGPPKDVAALRDVLSRRSIGSAPTRSQALNAALGEAVERYCGLAQGDEPRIRGSLISLGSQCIHPNDCMLFSAGQYRDRDRWNEMGSVTSAVPEPFDADAAIDWTPAWSLTRNERRLLPTAFLYREATHARGRSVCVADTNGNAAGRSFTDAILRGFLELVERDSIAIWWYNRLRRPVVDSAALDHPYLRDLARAYHSLGREYWILDLTTDLGVPTYGAVSRRRDSPREEILFGFGAHPDRERALLRAAAEMNQVVTGIANLKRADTLLPSPFARWLREATVDDQPFLRGARVRSIRPLHRASSQGEMTMRDADDPEASLRYCRTVVDNAGLELLVLDQTRPDIGVPVVKVIVPGLRPAAARLGAGRLFQVPTRLGWLPRPTSEKDLNPVPFFL